MYSTIESLNFCLHFLERKDILITDRYETDIKFAQPVLPSIKIAEKAKLNIASLITMEVV